ncbi:Fe(3+) dicitrate ABC transporter substrate-binding protein [Falsihalocynthiibacter sp. BN13B15]|uniref:ABC transporter substrate-binding protein n=1 Tax=Falsihalocynthiibacter sp. BN13B15 TaxID=3240871 RepID=UPI00350F0E88
MKMTRRVLLSVLAVGIATPVFAGEISHELGTTMVPENPQRIVVLEFSYIDALVSVGVVPVGIADDNKPERIMPVYGAVIGDTWTSVGTRKTPSLEVIASLQPDLILADKTRHTDAYATLSQIAPTVVMDSLSGDYTASVEQMLLIGEAIGKADAMNARVADHRAKMADYAEKIRPYAQNVRAQFGVANGEALFLHAPSSYNGSLLARLGFSPAMTPNEGKGYESNYVTTTLEQLSEINPDVLIIGEYADPSVTDNWENDALWNALKAVKDARVYNVEANTWSRLRGMVAAEQTAQDLLTIVGADGSDS